MKEAWERKNKSDSVFNLTFEKKKLEKLLRGSAKCWTKRKVQQRHKEVYQKAK